MLRKVDINNFLGSLGLISFILWVFMLFSGCNRANLAEINEEDAVIGVINGTNITVKDLRNEVSILMKKFRVVDLNKLTPEESLLLRLKGMNLIIQNVILSSEVKKNQIYLTRDEYREALSLAKNNYDGDSFSKTLNRRGISLEEWKKRHKNNLLIQKLIEENVNTQVSISDEKIKQYYDSNQDHFRKGDQVRSLHIMVLSESEIREILKILKSKKEDFSALAKRYSLAPEAATGGDLGYFEKDEMLEEFDGVFKLKIGEVSDTIKTPYGYHVFKVIDKKLSSQMTFDESRLSIYNKLLLKEQNRYFERWINDLKDKSNIEINYDMLANVN